MNPVFYIVLFTSIFMIGMGFAGSVGNRNPVKMLLSIEVSFNGVLLLLLYLATSLDAALLGADLSILAIGLSIGEIAIIMSVMIALFRTGMIRELDEKEFREEEAE
ncbi:MAG: NADH-quinone oxidoreductase subunit K [Nitrososphaerota archaeon]|jgi:NADH-quinone oxidoreductase subunit K|nr:NADH-quinone oxidoreductase subunit K [Nitrososphaerota archaeon]MDG7037717.1 NADH-quinone oxidoreductase subunit K [Nitrososphaerota archaeon]